MSNNKEKKAATEQTAEVKHVITDEEIAAAVAEDKAAKKNSWVGKAIIIGLAIACLVIYFAVPSVNTWVNNVIVMFKTGNFSAMRQFISQYGEWAMLISSLLMIFQSIAAPLPAFFITLTNANLFGWWQGCILSWVSSMAGAVMCFYIARILGRDVVEKICTKGALLSIEQFFDKYGKKCILIARLLPFISFDVVSYAAGLTSMDFWGFFIATGLGQLPACIVYSYVGGMLTGGAKLLFLGLLCLFALAIMVIIIKQIYNANEKKKREAAEASGVEYVKDKFDWTRFVTAFVGSAFIAMTLSMIAAKSAWFIMRMNMGWIFIGLWLVLVIVLYLVKRIPLGLKFTIVSFIVNLGIQVVLVGTSGLMITPASRLREGLMLPSSVTFGTLNIFIVVFVLAGVAAAILLNITKSKKNDKPVEKAEVKEAEAEKAEA